MENEKGMEQFYMSYKKALEKINQLNIKTRKGKEIRYKNLVEAINIMNKRHYKCRWKFKKYNGGKKFILVEGYYWLLYVYFQNEKSLIDADIDFFEQRIKQYEELLHVPSKKLWTKDLKLNELAEYFNRSPRTIRRGLLLMKQQLKDNNFISTKGKKKIILKEGVEWLCRNYFKKKLLQLLENYKMELTEQYIKKGYIYDYTNIIGI